MEEPRGADHLLRNGADRGRPPPEAEAIESIDGRRVGVAVSSPWAAEIESRGGIPVRMPPDRLRSDKGLVAAPVWRLQDQVVQPVPPGGRRTEPTRKRDER